MKTPDQLLLRPIETCDIPLLENFAPPTWNTNLPAFLTLHFGQAYFYAVVAVLDQAIVGIGEGIQNQEVGWLGNIIVSPQHQRQGIGWAVTQHLQERFIRLGCQTQILIASAMGAGLYPRLGFKTEVSYAFYRGEPAPATTPDDNIRQAAEADYPSILEIDQAVTGENRAGFIRQFLPTGWVYGTPGKVQGFYLPNLANGPVLAKTTAAGLALLEFKLGQGEKMIVLPSSNTPAQEFLICKGFVQYQQSPRMSCGKDLAWQPEGVFCRAAGYCG